MYSSQWIPRSLFPRPLRAWVRGYTHWCMEFQQWLNNVTKMQETTDLGNISALDILQCHAHRNVHISVALLHSWVGILTSCLAIICSLPSQVAVVYHRHVQDAKFIRCLLECVYALFWDKWSQPLKESFLLPTSICNLFKAYQSSTFWLADT